MTDEERQLNNLRVWNHFHAPQGHAPVKQVLKSSDKLSKSLSKLGLTPEEAAVFTGNKK